MKNGMAGSKCGARYSRRFTVQMKDLFPALAVMILEGRVAFFDLALRKLCGLHCVCVVHPNMRHLFCQKVGEICLVDIPCIPVSPLPSILSVKPTEDA